MRKNPITRIRYRIGRSRIHGRGTFATSRIRKGTRIVEYTGDVIDAQEAERRGEASNHVWLFDLEDGRFIDGNPRHPGPCVNHSCAPNCITEIVDDRVFIVADRSIEPGEELTYDYRFEPDVEKHLCSCGAARCRGTINLKPRRRRTKKRR